MPDETDHGCWRELIGKTVLAIRLIPGDPCGLFFEMSDGDFYEVNSHTPVWVQVRKND